MTEWWNKNAEQRMDDFKSWIGDFNQPTKIYCRNYIVNKKYKNVIDCGCGLATDYFGFKHDGHDVNYTGLDSCQYFIDTNREKGIPMVEAELESNLPISNNSYECVYCREVIEHLSYYQKTISEMIRIASKEVIIVWFIKPGKEEQINYWAEEDLYHNKYHKKQLENFIIDNPKVSKLKWLDILDVPYVVGEVLTEEEKLTFVGPLQPILEQPSGAKSVLHILLK